ncbi:hypothetical protein D3C81_1805330 [compost metagenome]
MTRAAIAIAPQIGIKSLFALCAPYTINSTKCVGYRLESGVGNNGTFYYPKVDLLATTMILDDVNNLDLASEEDRQAILELRNTGNVVRIEELRSKEIEIHYMLQLDNMERWNLKDVINQMTKQKNNNEFFDENNLNIL